MPSHGLDGDAISKKRMHPFLWVPTLYAAEGLPFVIIATVTSLMYKSLASLDPRITDARITFWTALVAVPWALKPLWGGLIEVFKTKRFFVLSTQYIGALAFGLLAVSLNLPMVFGISVAVFGIIAINFAVHDAAADGVYVTTLDPMEQARYVGWQGASYNVGRVLSQGGLVMFAGVLEKRLGVQQAWTVAMAAMGLLFLLLAIYHTKFLPQGTAAEGNEASLRSTFETFWDVVVTFFQKPRIGWGIAFLVLYRFAEGQAIKVVPLFLRSAKSLGGLGLTTDQVGKVYGVLPVLAFILGSIVGGYFTAHRGLQRSMQLLCIAFNIPFLVYVFLAFAQPSNLWLISSLMACDYFGYGFGFVALILFIMQQVAPGKYRTAHYAFATSIMQLGFLIPSMASGYLSDHLGYQKFFIWIVIATIPSFLIAGLVPFREVLPEEAGG